MNVIPLAETRVVHEDVGFIDVDKDVIVTEERNSIKVSLRHFPLLTSGALSMSECDEVTFDGDVVFSHNSAINNGGKANVKTLSGHIVERNGCCVRLCGEPEAAK